MNGFRYLAAAGVCMVAVLLSFNAVLGQFNLMVYPSCITAFNLYNYEKGVCQIEFLGEKAQLKIPDLELLVNRGVQSRQTLTENVYQTLKNEGMVVRRIWDTRFKDLALEGELERLLNTFEANRSLPLKEWLQKYRTGVWN